MPVQMIELEAVERMQVSDELEEVTMIKTSDEALEATAGGYTGCQYVTDCCYVAC